MSNPNSPIATNPARVTRYLMRGGIAAGRARAASKTLLAVDPGKHGRELALLLLLGFQLRVIRRDERPDIVRHSQQFKPLLFI